VGADKIYEYKKETLSKTLVHTYLG